MHIVILDARIFRVEKSAWDPFYDCGTVTIYDTTSPEQVVDQCADADIVCSCSIIYDASLLNRLQHVKLLCLLSSGYDKADLEAAQHNGIAVCAIPDYSTIAVAEYIFALLLHQCRAVAQHAQAVRSGRWYASKAVSYWESEHEELYGKQLGIIGYGHIGKALHIRAQAFGMKCAIYTRHPQSLVQFAQHDSTQTEDSELHTTQQSADEQTDDITKIGPHGMNRQTVDSIVVDLPTLLATSDIVSLHVPLTDTTRHMIGTQQLQLMKPSAILVNVARGGLIDETALYNALKAHAIRGAVLDVTQQEPLPPTHPLLTLDNCTITPHIAWATDAARTRLLIDAVRAIQSFQSGDNRYQIV